MKTFTQLAVTGAAILLAAAANAAMRRLIASAASFAAMPLRSEPAEAAVAEVFGTLPVEVAMSPFISFLRLLSDPTIAFLLFSIGSAGLLAELYNPNFVTGILGGLALILAFIGLGALPLNVAGLILIVFGLVMIGLELTVTSHGLLGFGGVVCIALGASALFNEPGDPFAPVVRVAPALIATVAITGGLFVALITTVAVRTRRMQGPGGLVGPAVTSGSLGVVKKPLDPLGSAFIAGEEWSARSADDRPIERGTPVKVVAVDGLTVLVEPEISSIARTKKGQCGRAVLSDQFSI